MKLTFELNTEEDHDLMRLIMAYLHPRHHIVIKRKEDPNEPQLTVEGQYL